jgi:uncharacterized protein
MDNKQMVKDITMQQLGLDNQLRELFARFPQITLVVLFGSIASGSYREDSDLDIAVSAQPLLSQEEKIALVSALAESTGRAIDLIDLNSVAEPLLGQIVQHGRKILGGDTLFGQLIYRHLIEQADFMPYQARLLAERRRAWIGK